MFEVVLVLLTLILDQGSKFLAMSELAPGGGALQLWPGVLHLTYLENQGAAFGMMQNMRWLLLIVTPIVAVAIIVYLVKHRHAPMLLRISLALMLSGALGNLIDRVLLGYVRDFIHIALINFAVFNVADSCVTIGAVLFGFYAFFVADKPKKSEPQAEKRSKRVYSTKPMRSMARKHTPRSANRPAKRYERRA